VARIVEEDLPNVPGVLFPDYQLPDQTGAMRKLSELQGFDPIVLVQSRGGF
jgi:peroxiredoxin